MTQHVFHNGYFYKKTSLYIHIPNIYLGLGFEFEFEFGPQKIRDLTLPDHTSVSYNIKWEGRGVGSKKKS